MLAVQFFIRKTANHNKLYHTQGRHAGKKKLHKMEIKPDQERQRCKVRISTYILGYL
jgi:hypothetical protein